MDLNRATVSKNLRKAFERTFGLLAQPALQVALAPGRVNLIGEHTDYNGGFVLPMAIDRHTAVVFRVNGGADFHVYAADAKGAREDTFPADAAAIGKTADPDASWANYVRGTAKALADQDVPLRGLDLYITGDLPQGAGLSSSASLEVGVALAILTSAKKSRMDRQQVALAAQKAEHTFAGVRCGIMDQSIVALAKARHALLLDCESLQTRHVPIALKGWSFAIFDTGVRHSLAGSEYNQRRAQCEKAALACSVESLRQAGPDALLGNKAKLGSAEHKRLRHVVGENLRTVQFAHLLGSGDTAQLGQLLHLSHQSLRDDYEVSCAELDFCVEFLTSISTAPGKLRASIAGARMTGGGFGGSVVALLKTRVFQQVRARLADAYRETFSRDLGGAWLVEPSQGALVKKL